RDGSFIRGARVMSTPTLPHLSLPVTSTRRRSWKSLLVTGFYSIQPRRNPSPSLDVISLPVAMT
ncbi:MAG: hypothetical protein ACOYM3_27245, partial [Terrimicrobiaceae bacterium]